MKKLLMILLLCPLLLTAQNILPRFENDTLYTSSGYKIYKGLTLQFGNGTGENKQPGTGRKSFQSEGQVFHAKEPI